jgi:rhodanese-related sulfurtransferase
VPTLPRPVVDAPVASSEVAQQHFGRLLELETDGWDVHAALTRSPDDPGFLLLDVRGPEAFAAGHLPGAVNLPHARITRRTLEDRSSSGLVVVYCAGPHCNGADRAALRLAGLGRPVKKMLGGVTGWLDEGFDLVVDDA